MHCGDIWPDMFHNAHYLMAHCDDGGGARYTAVLDVQIAGTDAGQCDLNNGVPFFQDAWLGLFQQRIISWREVGVGKQRFRSFVSYCAKAIVMYGHNGKLNLHMLFIALLI